MNAQKRDEISAAIWAARFQGLEVAALFVLLKAGPITRANLCRLMPERKQPPLYTAVNRLRKRGVLLMDGARLVSIDLDWQLWRDTDGRLIFARNSSAEAGLLSRLGILRSITTEGAPVPRIEPAQPAVTAKGVPVPYRDEPGQHHLVDQEGGALDESEDARWEKLTKRLTAAHKRKS